MKKVTIIHGWGGNPDEKPLVWLEQELQARGFSVIRPAMPDPEYPEIDSWLRALEETINTDNENILIGHSIGCQAILRFLAKTKTRVNKVILIAPWFDLKADSYESEEEKEIAKPWIETPIDFVSINCNDIIAIFSDNDYFVDEKANADILKAKLNAKIIVEHGKLHFSEGDGITTLPSVLETITK